MKIQYLKAFENIHGSVSILELNELMENRAATDELIEVINFTTKNAEELSSQPTFILHIIAMFVLSYWEEKKAFLPLINMAKLPEDLIEPLLEDKITEALAPAFAATYNGDFKQLTQIIENEACEIYTRISALHSLLILYGAKKISREKLVAYFLELFHNKVHVLDEQMMEFLVDFSIDIHPKGMEKEIKFVMELEYMKYSFKEVSKRYEEQKCKSIERAFEDLKEDEYHQQFTKEKVLSLVDLLGDWELDEDVEDEDASKDMPFVHTTKVARNDFCLCGSGKKYKKCCGV